MTEALPYSEFDIEESPVQPNSERRCRMVASSVLLAISSAFVLLSFVLSTPFIGYLVRQNVIVGEVNGTLTLGTVGYCLNVSDQNDCSFRLFGTYTFNNTLVFTQHTINPDTSIKIFSVANILAWVLGGIVVILIARDTRCARRAIFKESRMMMNARVFACASTLSALVAFSFALSLSSKASEGSKGVGLWLNLIALIFFLGFASSEPPKSGDKETSYTWPIWVKIGYIIGAIVTSLLQGCEPRC